MEKEKTPEEEEEEEVEEEEDEDEDFDFSEAMKCVKLQTKFERIAVKELGRGASGRIYAICEVTEKIDSDCKKIVKIITGGIQEDMAKELEIFKQLNDSGLTPKVYESFQCGDYFFIVMERFDTNMQKRAEDMAEAHKLPDNFTQQFWREEDIHRMFEIAYELSNKYGIIHGDLKPNQYLYRAADNKIVVSDFGFSGTADGKMPAKRGWSKFEECGHFQPLPPRKTTAWIRSYEQYFNMYQLWSYLVFRVKPICVFLVGTSEPRYLPSQSYIYQFGHLAIPRRIIDGFIEDETLSCRGREFPVQNRIDYSIMRPYG